jgi:hypothetical protein
MTMIIRLQLKTAKFVDGALHIYVPKSIVKNYTIPSGIPCIVQMDVPNQPPILASTTIKSTEPSQPKEAAP